MCFEHDVERAEGGGGGEGGRGGIISTIYIYDILSVVCRWSGAGIATTGVGCECVDHWKTGIGVQEYNPPSPCACLQVETGIEPHCLLLLYIYIYIYFFFFFCGSV